MGVYAGKKSVLYLSTSASGAASNVIKLNSMNIDQSTETIDVSAFGDSNKTYVLGLKDGKASFNGFFDDTEAKYFTAADSSDGCKFYWYPSSDAPTKYWYGQAWVSGVSIQSSVNGPVAINGNLAANGAWSRL